MTNRETLLRRDDIVEALNHARKHWEEIASESADARKAAQAITAVLENDSNSSSAQPAAPYANGAFVDPAFEFSDPDYLSGFDFTLDMPSDPVDQSFFPVDQDPVAFGGFDQFAAGQNTMP